MTHRKPDKHGKTNVTAKDATMTPTKIQTTVQTTHGKLEGAVDIRDYGAKGDGITDDTAALQAAINSGAGLIKVFGTTTVTSTIDLVSNQIVYVGAGNSIVWSGPAGSTMFESPADKMYVRAGIWCDGGYIDMSGCSIGIQLHSYQYCLFDWESTDSTNSTTSTIVYSISDSTSNTDSITGTRNTTNNYWRRLMHHLSCGTLLRMAGTEDDSGEILGNTLNSFGKIRSDGNCEIYGIDIGPWCDTNDFNSMVSIDCGTGATAINLRDYPTVYNIIFHQVNVAMYGSSSNRRGIYVGDQVRWVIIEHFYIDSSNTAEVDAGAIVDGGAISYKINLCRAGGQYAGLIETRSKNFSLLAGNLSFSESFSLASGIATSISNIPTNGCIVAYNSSNGDFTGICYARSNASPACFSIAGNDTYMAFTTGALGNGGGTNNRLNISAGSDGNLYISNRVQLTLDLTITCLGGLY